MLCVGEICNHNDSLYKVLQIITYQYINDNIKQLLTLWK